MNPNQITNNNKPTQKRTQQGATLSVLRDSGGLCADKQKKKVRIEAFESSESFRYKTVESVAVDIIQATNSVQLADWLIV